MKLHSDGSIKAIYTAEQGKKQYRPLMSSKIAAGFHLQLRIILKENLILTNPYNPSCLHFFC
jgi:hypothetical protein